MTPISGTQAVVIGESGGTTLVPINSALPGLTGSITVISSSGEVPSTYVVVTGETTIPGAAPTGGVSGGNATTTTNPQQPLQANGGTFLGVGGTILVTLLALCVLL